MKSEQLAEVKVVMIPNYAIGLLFMNHVVLIDDNYDSQKTNCRYVYC